MRLYGAHGSAVKLLGGGLPFLMRGCSGKFPTGRDFMILECAGRAKRRRRTPSHLTRIGGFGLDNHFEKS